MESMLFRNASGSIPVQSPFVPVSSRLSASLSIQAVANNGISSPVSRRIICRSYSEPDVARSELRTLTNLGSRSFTALRIPEMECDESINPAEELGFPGGRMNKNRKSGGDPDRHRIGAYYQEMLKSDPTNSLLLTNYAKYLHQVEGDLVKAEEYYGRAILCSPGDGQVLCLYGKLIWETHRDESRAKSYFNQALETSPHDCMIMGSYAHFLWEAEEEIQSGVPAMLEAF